ncbi:MAG: hypothetical protein KC766_33600 [Myxococcales bacterium]|nr:hypothetical protein [Myxococcales bacterium]
MTEPAIELGVDTPDEGLAAMLAQLVRQNLQDHPAKKPVLSRMVGRIALIAEDIATEVTLHFQGGRLVVSKGIIGVPDVVIRTTTDQLTKMSLIELGRFGLPSPRGAVVRQIGDAMRHGAIHGHGVFANLPLVARFTRIMSVNPG